MILVAAFNELVFKPLLNLLIFIVDVVPGGDLGIAIILVTIFIRFLLLPLSYKQAHSQHKLTKLHPEIKRVQIDHKHDKQAAARAVMALYKEHKINPLSGFVPLLVQLPLIFGLFQIFRLDFSNGVTSGLYSFVARPEHIDTVFLGFMNLTEPSAALAALTGLAQFLQSKITFKKYPHQGENQDNKPDFQRIMRTQMTYVMPLVITFIALSFPAGLALYWFTTTVFSAVQQYFINKKLD